MLRKREYHPETVNSLNSLQEKVEKLRIQEKHEDYSWIEDAFDINFWKFRMFCYHAAYWFFIFMDNSKWDDLAVELGLSGEEIMWCRQYHKKGPTEEAFMRMAERGSLTLLSLGEVLQKLRKLKLTAILTRVNWQKGIEEYRAAESNKVLSMSELSCAPKTFPLDIHQRSEVLVNASNISKVKFRERDLNTRKGSRKHSKAATLILIFAADARDEAMKAAEQLKEIEKNGSKLGIMILTPPVNAKMENELLVDPCNSIHKWFKQVDYVVPFLSPQLLLQIQDRDPEPNTTMDKLYNRYLYRLTLDDYVSKMSKNYKCRPLCSSDYSSEVRNSELVQGNGLLQMNWICSSSGETEQFWDLLVSGARERRGRIHMA